MLYSSVALSIVLSFISAEFIGVLTGGMISAGYLAYYAYEPTRILSTLAVAVLICFLVKALQHFLIIYGRRRFILCTLISVFSVFLLERCYFYLSTVSVDLRVIGYIIPGLIASDMLKQGILKTLLALTTVTAVVYLVILFVK